MRIEVGKSQSLLLVVGILIVGGVIGVFAFGTNNPPVFGHSAGELQVMINGTTYTLREAITQNLIGGGVTTEEVCTPEVSAWTDTEWVGCNSPEQTVELYCLVETNWYINPNFRFKKMNTHHDTVHNVYNQTSKEIRCIGVRNTGNNLGAVSVKACARCLNNSG